MAIPFASMSALHLRPAPMEVFVRRARLQELPRAAEILAAGYAKIPSTALYHPGLAKHPKAYLYGWLLEIERLFYKSNAHVYVALKVNNDASIGSHPLRNYKHIVGVAVWEHKGWSTLAQKKREQTFRERLNYMRADLKKRFYYNQSTPGLLKTWWLNSWAKLTCEELAEIWPGVEDQWLFLLMAVAPEASRKGVGSQLMEHGVRWAGRVDATVIAQVPISAEYYFWQHGFEYLMRYSRGTADWEYLMVKFNETINREEYRGRDTWHTYRPIANV